MTQSGSATASFIWFVSYPLQVISAFFFSFYFRPVSSKCLVVRTQLSVYFRTRIFPNHSVSLLCHSFFYSAFIVNLAWACYLFEY